MQSTSASVSQPQGSSSLEAPGALDSLDKKVDTSPLKSSSQNDVKQDEKKKEGAIGHLAQRISSIRNKIDELKKAKDFKNAYEEYKFLVLLYARQGCSLEQVKSLINEIGECVKSIPVENKNEEREENTIQLIESILTESTNFPLSPLEKRMELFLGQLHGAYLGDLSKDFMERDTDMAARVLQLKQGKLPQDKVFAETMDIFKDTQESFPTTYQGAIDEEKDDATAYKAKIKINPFLKTFYLCQSEMHLLNKEFRNAIDSLDSARMYGGIAALSKGFAPVLDEEIRCSGFLLSLAYAGEMFFPSLKEKSLKEKNSKERNDFPQEDFTEKRAVGTIVRENENCLEESKKHLKEWQTDKNQMQYYNENIPSYKPFFTDNETEEDYYTCYSIFLFKVTNNKDQAKASVKKFLKRHPNNFIALCYQAQIASSEKLPDQYKTALKKVNACMTALEKKEDVQSKELLAKAKTFYQEIPQDLFPPEAEPPIGSKNKDSLKDFFKMSKRAKKNSKKSSKPRTQARPETPARETGTTSDSSLENSSPSRVSTQITTMKRVSAPSTEDNSTETHWTQVGKKSKQQTATPERLDRDTSSRRPLHPAASQTGSKVDSERRVSVSPAISAGVSAASTANRNLAPSGNRKRWGVALPSSRVPATAVSVPQFSAAVAPLSATSSMQSSSSSAAVTSTYVVPDVTQSSVAVGEAPSSFALPQTSAALASDMGAPTAAMAISIPAPQISTLLPAIAPSSVSPSITHLPYEEFIKKFNTPASLLFDLKFSSEECRSFYECEKDFCCAQFESAKTKIDTLITKCYTHPGYLLFKAKITFYLLLEKENQNTLNALRILLQSVTLKTDDGLAALYLSDCNQWYQEANLFYNCQQTKKVTGWNLPTVPLYHPLLSAGAVGPSMPQQLFTSTAVNTNYSSTQPQPPTPIPTQTPTASSPSKAPAAVPPVEASAALIPSPENKKEEQEKLLSKLKKELRELYPSSAVPVAAPPVEASAAPIPPQENKKEQSNKIFNELKELFEKQGNLSSQERQSYENILEFFTQKDYISAAAYINDFLEDRPTDIMMLFYKAHVAIYQSDKGTLGKVIDTLKPLVEQTQEKLAAIPNPDLHSPYLKKCIEFYSFLRANSNHEAITTKVVSQRSTSAWGSGHKLFPPFLSSPAPAASPAAEQVKDAQHPLRNNMSKG